MEILHFNSNYLHSPLYSEMFNQLEKQGVRNDVIMPRKIKDEANVSDKLIETNTTVFEKQFLKPIDRFFYFKKQKKILDWVHTLNLSNYDIVHAHTLFSDGYQALKTGKAYIVTVRNTDINFYMKFYKHLIPLGRKILEEASQIIFLSESYKKTTIEMMFGNKKIKNKIYEKSHVIPNGINDFWLKNSSDQIKRINEDIDINVICVCRIMKNKNLEFLAKNLTANNLGRNINIYIVGDVVDSKYYQSLKSYPNMHFLGKKDKKNIAKIMKDMHMFIMVSFTETFGLVYLEALTQNLPVIYTKNEGFDKYFEDGYIGYPVSPTNDYELIMQVRRVIENYNRVQRNINQLDKRRFSWRNNAIKHKELYEITKASVE